MNAYMLGAVQQRKQQLEIFSIKICLPSNLKSSAVSQTPNILEFLVYDYYLCDTTQQWKNEKLIILFLWKFE